ARAAPRRRPPGRLPPRLSDRRARGRWLAGSASGPLEPEVLERAGVREALDQVDAGLLHARADPPDERQLVDRHVNHLVAEDLLDLVERRLALLRIELARLALEEILALGQDAGRVDAALRHVGLEPRGRVARRARDAHDHVLELLLAPGGGHGGTFHRPDL